MDAPRWSGSTFLCYLLWRNHSLFLHRTSLPSQAFSLTTLLLFWKIRQQALAGRQDTGSSEVSQQSSWQSGCSIPACLLPFWLRLLPSVLPTGLVVGYSEQDVHPFPVQKR